MTIICQCVYAGSNSSYEFYRDKFYSNHRGWKWWKSFLNGEYRGTYQFCEQVKIAGSRVDIHDWEDYAGDVAYFHSALLVDGKRFVLVYRWDKAVKKNAHIIFCLIGRCFHALAWQGLSYMIKNHGFIFPYYTCFFAQIGRASCRERVFRAV